MALLGGSLARNIASMLLSPLMAQGFSGNAALSWLKTQGVGYRRTTFLSDWRRLKSNFNFANNFALAGRPQNIPEELITEAPFQSPGRYKYIVEARGFDASTMRDESRYLTIMSNTQLSLDDVMADAELIHSFNENNSGDTGFLTDEFVLDSVEHNELSEG